MIRGIVVRVFEGVIKRFSASGRSNETFENREYLQHYGFTSRPLQGAELVILREGNNILAVASDDRRYRVLLDEGELCLYTDEGDKVHMKRNREIEITGGEKVTIFTKEAVVSASQSCSVTAPQVTVAASSKITCATPLLEVSGQISAAGISATGGISAAGGITAQGNIQSIAGHVSDSVRSMAGDRDIYNLHGHAPYNTTPNRLQ